MPKAILSLFVLLAAGAAPVHAQASYFARLGAVGASRLLRDFVVETRRALLSSERPVLDVTLAA